MPFDKQKAITQFRLRLNGILNVFRVYGMDIYIPGSAEAIEKLALELHERLNETESKGDKDDDNDSR